MDIQTFVFGFLAGLLSAFILTFGVCLRFLMPFIREAQEKARRS